MDLFFIDNLGQSELLNKDETITNNSQYATKILSESVKSVLQRIRPTTEDDNDDDDDDDENTDDFINVDFSHVIKPAATVDRNADDLEIEDFCRQLAECQRAATQKGNHFVTVERCALGRTDVGKEMKAAIGSEIERQQTVARPSETQKAKLRKLEAAKTKGGNWYNMPATEMTEEVHRDLELIQMRSVLDPKHFYKKNDLKALPKYFQVGKVLPSPLDFYNERGERKNKKKTIVDELMADAQFQKFNKRKYNETMQDKSKSGYHKAHKKMKKLKKNK